jgi:hypothetical protein
MRRDHASTPPKPDIEMVAKAMNSSASVGATFGRTAEGARLEASDQAMAGRRRFRTWGTLAGIVDVGGDCAVV